MKYNLMSALLIYLSSVRLVFVRSHVDFQSSNRKPDQDLKHTHGITEARAPRRADAEGVSQENTDEKYKTTRYPVRLVFSSVFSCEAGRFTAGQLDAPPHSQLTSLADE